MLHGWSIFTGWKKHGNTPKSCYEYVNPLWELNETLVLSLHSKREWSNSGYNYCKNNGPPAYQSSYFGGKIVLPNMLWVSSQFPMTALFLLHAVMTISRKREEFPTCTTGHLFSSFSLPYFPICQLSYRLLHELSIISTPKDRRDCSHFPTLTALCFQLP